MFSLDEPDLLDEQKLKQKLSWLETCLPKNIDILYKEHNELKYIVKY